MVRVRSAMGYWVVGLLGGCGAGPQPAAQAPETVVAVMGEAPAPADAAAQSAAPQPADRQATVPETVSSAPTPPAQPEATARAPSKLAPVHQGTIGARSARLLTLRMDGIAGVAAGERARLYRRFAQALGPVTVTGWLEIAEVVVKKADGGVVVVEIVAEKSDIRVNGRQLDHFGVGETVKLEF